MARQCNFCDRETSWAIILRDQRVLCPACERIEWMKSHIVLGGDYGGKVFEPAAWFRELIEGVYGPRNEGGLRIVEDVYEEIAKGNGKTTSIAALVLSELCLTHAAGTEIYSAATTKHQAANTYRYCEQMIQSSQRLRRKLKYVSSQKKIYKIDDPTSFYMAVSSDGDKWDGFAPQMVIRDEVHVWRSKASRTLYTILEKSATTKRVNPLIIDITTAGERDGSLLCWSRHEYCRGWLEGANKNKKFFGRIYAAEQKRMDEEPDYWKSRQARVEANPCHEDNGGHIKDDVFAAMVSKAENDPVEKAEYCRYNLNYWGTDLDAVIDYPKWLKCHGGEDIDAMPEYDPELLIRRWDLFRKPCWLGLDLGSSEDLTALAAVFPPIGKREAWAILMWYWMPIGKVMEKTKKDNVPYLEWVGKKFINGHDRLKTESTIILPTIKYCRQMFRVQELCYDDWNADALIKRIETGDEHGLDIVDIECKDIDQSIGQLNEPTKWLTREGYQNGLIMHGNHPVLNWNARNLGLKADSNNNIKPRKVMDKDPKKIDGISAVVNALRRALLVGVENDSVGVRVL